MAMAWEAKLEESKSSWVTGVFPENQRRLHHGELLRKKQTQDYSMQASIIFFRLISKSSSSSSSSMAAMYSL